MNTSPDAQPRGVIIALARAFMSGPLSILFLIAAVMMGLFALINTPQEEDPQIVVPMVNVFVQVPGRTSAEVEEHVTRPLERLLWQIDGVEHVYSISRMDEAIVTVRFFVGEDRETSIVKVRDQIESNQDLAPPSVTGWLVKPVQIDDVPIVQLTFFSPERSLEDIRRVAEEVKARLDSAPDISLSEIYGGMPHEIRVEPDLEALVARGVGIADIVAALQGSMPWGDAGEVIVDGVVQYVRVSPRLRRVEDVRDTHVRSAEGRPVRIGDVARVYEGPGEPLYYHHIGFGPAEREFPALHGERLPAVTLAYAKKRGRNAITVANNIIARADALRGTIIPDDVHIRVTRDYGATAREKVNTLLSNMGFAILTVMALIALAMGWREGLVVGLAVPISFSLALFVNYIAGFTINRVTLFALILSLGLVVDDPITNVDNIQRHIRMGVRRPWLATQWALKEMIAPVLMSTLTIIVCFLPLFFITGMMGPYMRPMAVNVPVTVSFSTLCALTFVPWLAYRLLRHRHGKTEQSAENTNGAGVDVTPAWIRNGYRRVLSPFLSPHGRRLLYISIVILFCASGLLVVLRLVPLKMLPFDNKDELQLVVDMPEGTTREKTDAVCQALEAYLSTVNEVRDFQTYAGMHSPIDFNGLVRQYAFRRAPHFADIRIALAPKARRAQQSHEIALRIRDDITGIAEAYGALVRIVEMPPGPPVLSTLVGEVYGGPDSSYDDMLYGARVLQERMAYTDPRHIREIDDMSEAPHTYMALDVDEEKAARHGLTPRDISAVLRMAIGGERAAMMYAPQERDPLFVRVQLPFADRADAGRLSQLWLTGRDGRLVPLGELAQPHEALRPQPIFRKDLERVVFVTAECVGRPPGETVLQLAGALRRNPLPEGIDVKWAGEGEWRITVDVFRDLGIAFGVALLGIYVLLVAQTGSFALPVIMMTAIPLTAIGILPGFWLLNIVMGRTVGGYPSPVFFTATAMIGMIALGGIVIRNSVVLIEFVHESLKEGTALKDALLQSGAVRFRPIVLTALTTLLGVWPITLDPIFSGLAWALIFGLLASTAFTLVVIPTVYYHLYAGRPMRTAAVGDEQ